MFLSNFLSSLFSVAQPPSRPITMYVREWQEPAAIYVQDPIGGLDQRHPGSFAWNMVVPDPTDFLSDVLSCF